MRNEGPGQDAPERMVFDPRTGQHRDHDEFIMGLLEKRKVMISFFSTGGADHEIRSCAPVDFGPSGRFKDKTNRYHFFDFTGRPGPHPMALKAEQIYRIRVTDEHFEPEAFLGRYRGPGRWWIDRRWSSRVEEGG